MAMRRLVGWAAWVCVFCLYSGVLLVLPLLRRRGVSRARCKAQGGIDLLITARFDSQNWCKAHLLPIAEADGVHQIIAVVDGPTLTHRKVDYRRPPSWLTATLGRTASKGIWMLRVACSSPPDVIMGYHFFPGAITGLLIARSAGARSIYQMTGGPVELIGGGSATENPLLGRLCEPSPLLEHLAIRICREFDAIVVRGAKAVRFLRERGITSTVAVITGGVDTERFYPNHSVPEYDLVTVGRLVPIKRLELFLQIVAALAQRRQQTRAAIVGDGPLFRQLQADAQRLGIQDRVEFLGLRDDIPAILQKSRLFALTSDNEGLSIALLEAMSAGLPAVVPDIGELSEVVHQGKTGLFIVPNQSMESANKLAEVLADEDKIAGMSRAARREIEQFCSIRTVTSRWEVLIEVLSEKTCQRK